MRFVKEVFTDATITANVKKDGGWPNKISIYSSSFGKTNQLVWEGPQRDLYRKYGWPAEKGIKKALRTLPGAKKEETK
ncbi:hypothetical protein AAMO2058_001476100 [Amorphochlora amoebiformis]